MSADRDEFRITSQDGVWKVEHVDCYWDDTFTLFVEFIDNFPGRIARHMHRDHGIEEYADDRP